MHILFLGLFAQKEMLPYPLTNSLSFTTSRNGEGTYSTCASHRREVKVCDEIWQHFFL